MSEPDPVTVLDLFVEEPVLGNDSRFFREAGVAFGRATVGPIGDEELSEPTRRRLDLPRLRFATLQLPFDLQQVKHGRQYVEATIRMAFDPDVRIVRLECVTTGGDVEVRTFGVGRDELSCVLSPRPDLPGFAPSAQVATAVLEAPLGQKRMTGTLDASVVFTHAQFGRSVRKIAEPKHPLRFVLDLVDGAYDALVSEG